ncbi:MULTISPECIES: DUF2252 family protein [Acinetobacter]|uniref:DUF2252 family protein n=1 Tax=Acinetobacter TaxID=469 RepID=UPI0002AEDE2A|nr:MULTISPECIES: DUF2252 family protein [Acinetobacter]ELW81338.1 PF10009 family protein [Acinetobacter sp. WC-743]MBJ8425575.1 DUF2252 family protein [Acinetobacter bereziniae]MBJ8473584.1 DUF2252 family protein [Acinetobacter bereziniae]
MSKKQNTAITQPRYRNAELTERRNLKMARSIHAYVRGNTAKYYDWLKQAEISSIPQGPAIWICGDCHTGNLGPVANAEGKIDIEIRDLDQTVIGNPANDLIRLGLSLATAVRSSDLPGVVTAQMIEALYAGYIYALERSGRTSDQLQRPALVHSVMEKAVKRSWKRLAKERLEDVKPQITLGKRFWPLLKKEQLEIHNVFAQPDIEDLVKMIGQRDASAQLKVIDSAYWVKGCSSLGLLRYIVLMDSSNHIVRDGKGLCLMDLKEATTALAPRYSNAPMPKDNAMRIVEGARHLSPYLGERMRATKFLERSIFIRELLPQDLKLEIEGMNQTGARDLAFYLAFVVGRAHVRQMDDSTRNSWLKELQRNQSKTIDAPFWLWRSIVELISVHEAGYLDHCRRYALAHQK